MTFPSIVIFLEKSTAKPIGLKSYRTLSLK
jgi:hypothetical protein